MNRRMNDELLTAYVLGEVSETERQQVEEAVRLYSAVAARVEDIRKTTAALQAELAPDPSLRLDPARKAALLRALPERKGFSLPFVLVPLGVAIVAGIVAVQVLPTRSPHVPAALEGEPFAEPAVHPRANLPASAPLQAAGPAEPAKKAAAKEEHAPEAGFEFVVSLPEKLGGSEAGYVLTQKIGGQLHGRMPRDEDWTLFASVEDVGGTCTLQIRGSAPGKSTKFHTQSVPCDVGAVEGALRDVMGRWF